MGNKRNVSEDESILDSIDESSTDDDSDGRHISTNAIEDICGGKYVHPDINARYSILEGHDHIMK